MSISNNDLFANRIRLTPESTDATTNTITASGAGNNAGYGGEPGEPNHDGRSLPLASAWWTWPAPASGTTTIDTTGSGNNPGLSFSFDTTLAVYTGSTIGGPTIASNDDFNGFFSRVQFDAVVGVPYQIAVDTYFGAFGQPIKVNLSQTLTFSQSGTLVADNLYGSGANDVMRGLAGNDNLYGNGGNDALFGGAGNDQLFGGAGNDYLDGGSGNDMIYGNSSNDTLLGGEGNDTLYSGGNGREILANGGKSLLLGGSGDDLIYGNDGDFIDSGSGNDTVYVGSSRGNAKIVLADRPGYLRVNARIDSGAGQFVLDGALTFGQLSFTDTSDGVRITASSGDLLAIVSWQQAGIVGQASNFV
jgi:serralysin